MLYPVIVQIEITDACNLECIYCDIHEHHKNPGLMDYNKVISLIEEAWYAQHVCPQYWGEPTLHPRFLNILKFCRASGKTTSFYTNGVLLDTFDLYEILNNTTQMRISMDNFTAEGFRKTTGRDWFERAKRNIISCWKIKEKFGLQTKIILRATELESEEVSKEAFVECWGAYCDSIEFKPLRFATRKEGVDLIKRDQCDMITRHVVITRDGTMVLCCSDHNKECPIGNVFESRILDLFNSEPYNHLRGNIGQNAVCENCWYRYKSKTSP